MLNFHVLSSRTSASGNVWATLAPTLAEGEQRDNTLFQAKVPAELPAGTQITNVEVTEIGEPREVPATKPGQAAVRFQTVVLRPTAETTVVAPFQVPVSEIRVTTQASAPHRA